MWWGAVVFLKPDCSALDAFLPVPLAMAEVSRDQGGRAQEILPRNYHQGPRGNKPAGSGLALRTGASSSPLSKPSPRQLSLGAWCA